MINIGNLDSLWDFWYLCGVRAYIGLSIPMAIYGITVEQTKRATTPPPVSFLYWPDQSQRDQHRPRLVAIRLCIDSLASLRVSPPRAKHPSVARRCGRFAFLCHLALPFWGVYCQSRMTALYSALHKVNIGSETALHRQAPRARYRNYLEAQAAT